MTAWTDAFAESKPYLIGPEDVIEVKFWQDPTLNASVRVREDGVVTLDIIGEIVAAGLTEAELQDNIVKLISRINRQISQATVRVTQYNSRKVFIFGEVLKPGKYTFEEIPDLWTLINEAGGTTITGDLTRVRIIRGGTEVGKVEEVDVAGMLSRGEAAKLPTIRPGDTIELIKTFGGVEQLRSAGSGGLRNVYYVIGDVKNPGARPLEATIDLLDAIALAGGPMNTADLSKVRVLTKDGPFSQVTTINVEKYTETGKPARYIVRPEDTIVLPTRGSGKGFLGISRVTDVVALVSSVASIALLANQVR